MSSDLAKLRAAAEPYKSFPVAVAAVVRAMFDRGAGSVRIEYVSASRDWMVWIKSDRPSFSRAELEQLMTTEGSWIFAFVHHSEVFRLITPNAEFVMDTDSFDGAFWPWDEIDPRDAHNRLEYWFDGLGKGAGVNSKQDRSAKRLIRELPRHLSPSEAYHTVVIDEAGTKHSLVKALPSTVIDGLRVSWPEKMVGFGREGLTLKFGAVRMSMRSFIERLSLEPREREQLMLLTHPWLQGIVEVEVADPQMADLPVPPEPTDNFIDFFYRCGHAYQLASAILHIVPGVALREMSKTVNANLSDFCNQGGELVLEEYTYKLTCAEAVSLWCVDRVVLGWAHVPLGESHTQIYLNPTHPVFRTIGPDRDEIMQVIWWQLAMWVAQEQLESDEFANFSVDCINNIYLALREQNPERWDD